MWNIEYGRLRCHGAWVGAETEMVIDVGFICVRGDYYIVGKEHKVIVLAEIRVK